MKRLPLFSINKLAKRKTWNIGKDSIILMLLNIDFIKFRNLRTRKIKGLVKNHFHGHPDTNLIVEHYTLLERISPVIEVDSKVSEITQDPYFPQLNSRDETVLKTLLYLCYHHYDKVKIIN